MDEVKVTSNKHQKKKADVYKNIHVGCVYICGHRVLSGATYELTETDKAHETNIKRIASAVRLKLIEKV